MQLKRLEIAGFKSFAQKSVFLFDTPVTAIVGPNGSGKSNVAEAFRWALGEQSLKSLRGKRGEDLIFNGGARGDRASRATVAVTFDNHDRQFNVDFDEVTISRTVYQDGTNEYKINNSVVRLKDIIETLAAVSLGASGHHIISQGEADRVLAANPAERREMIEDALGLKAYQWKIAESEKKLEKTATNQEQVESLRRELAPQLKFLKKQVEKIEQADTWRQELKKLYADYIPREGRYLAQSREALAGTKPNADRELAAINTELKNIGGGGDKQTANKLDDYRQKLAAVKREKDEVARKIGRLEGMIEIKQAAASVAETHNDTVAAAAVGEVAKDLATELDAADKSGDLSALRLHLVALRNLAKRLASLITGQTKTVDHTADLAKWQSELKAAQADLERLTSEENKWADELEGERQNAARAAEAARGAERDRLLLEMKQNEISARLAAWQAETARLDNMVADLKREINEGVVLVNREILNYAEVVVEGDEVAEAARTAQAERRRAIEKLKLRLEDFGLEGSDVLEEYKQASERDTFLAKELADLTAAAEALKKVMTELQQKIDHEFSAGLVKINTEFDRFFKLMFGGGTAHLSLAKSERRKMADDLEMPEDGEPADDQVREGIEIAINLPRKKIKGLMMLSGGERALTSIALLFAMSQVKPPPFLILDETDAALDEANSRKYSDLVENLAARSQLVLVTHNRETMSRAGILYGVTMGADGISRLLSVKFDEAAKWAK